MGPGVVAADPVRAGTLAAGCMTSAWGSARSGSVDGHPWSVQALCVQCGDAILASFGSSLCFTCATGRERVLRPRLIRQYRPQEPRARH